MKVAIIPARGGSRRIPRKNIREFMGKPIIAYSIETARKSGLFDQIYVSTEDREIAQIGHAYGAQWMARSDDLANDQVGTQKVAQAALRELFITGATIDVACVLYATAPLVRSEDLWRAYMALLNNQNTWYAFACGRNPNLSDAGCFYFGRAAAFMCGAPLFDEHTAMIPLPPERCIDINVEDDWQRAERMYAALHNEEAA